MWTDRALHRGRDDGSIGPVIAPRNRCRRLVACRRPAVPGGCGAGRRVARALLPREHDHGRRSGPALDRQRQLRRQRRPRPRRRQRGRPTTSPCCAAAEGLAFFAAQGHRRRRRAAVRRGRAASTRAPTQRPIWRWRCSRRTSVAVLTGQTLGGVLRAGDVPGRRLPARRCGRAASTPARIPTWPSPTERRTPSRCCSAPAGATFGPATTLAVGDQPNAIATGDFNGDGDPDLAAGELRLRQRLGPDRPRRRDVRAAGPPSASPGAPAGSRWATSTATAIPISPWPTRSPTTSRSCSGSRAPASRRPRRSWRATNLAPSWPPTSRATVASTWSIANTVGDTVSILVGDGAGGFAPRVRLRDRQRALRADRGRSRRRRRAGPRGGQLGRRRHRAAAQHDSAGYHDRADSGPTGLTADSTPSFEFSADEPGARFECRIDGGAFVACATPFTTAPLPDGAHTLEVRAIDPAGNVDATPAERARSRPTRRRRRRRSPAAPARSPPTRRRASTSPPTRAPRSSAVSTARRSHPAPRRSRPPRCADGAHTFEARAIDAAGNVDATPASRAFDSDVTQPNTTIRSGPKGRTTDLTPRFSFSSSDAGSSFACRVDKKAFAACTTPFTAGRLKAGQARVRGQGDRPRRQPWTRAPAKRTFTALLD